MAPAEDADITPFGMSCAGGEPPLVLQLGRGCAWTIQFDKLEGATQQGVPFDIEPSPQPMLLRALLAVPSGEAVYGAPVARRIVAFTGAHQQYAAQVVPELTEREREVLELVAASLGNHKIARRLGGVPLVVEKRLL